MLDILNYPFDSEEILKHRKKIRKSLIESLNPSAKPLKIAVLGGSTTHDIISCLELFLLDLGYDPQFYESDYGMYYEDAIFPNEKLLQFKPDFIFVHTSLRNLKSFPLSVELSENQVMDKINEAFDHFCGIWKSLEEKFNCPIIQNNFEFPSWRLFGNSDSVNIHGMVYCVNLLNMKFAEYARDHSNFFINDLNYISSYFGIENWSDPKYWHMYKYAMNYSLIPEFSYSVFKIIRSQLGRNKKVLCLDLDNTLWGGVIGDDGIGGIEIGEENPEAQSFSEFQKYIKSQKQIGAVLCINSKNDYENAIYGLNHPESILKPDDFADIKANWNSKDRNLIEIADDLTLLPESFVFIDDNPAEREIILQNIPDCAVPKFSTPDECMKILDGAGYFEVTNLSKSDTMRGEMYKENAKRKTLQKSFSDYGKYLESLEMHAEIDSFKEIYYQRIFQLCGKSNQFNLTTRRYSLAEIENIAASSEYISLSGRLQDKFGDNGIVSLVVGKIVGKELHIELWLMSCRVLKRGMEYAMLDELVKRAKENNIEKIYGYYYKTPKNAMVSDLYGSFGFKKTESCENGDGVWEMPISSYKNKNKYIKVNNL